MTHLAWRQDAGNTLADVANVALRDGTIVYYTVIGPYQRMKRGRQHGSFYEAKWYKVLNGVQVNAGYVTLDASTRSSAKRMAQAHFNRNFSTEGLLHNPGRPHGEFARILRGVRRSGNVDDPEAVAAATVRRMYGNPMLHKVESLGPNQTEVSHGDVVGFISYETPVAIVTRGPGGHYDAFVTDKKWSNTTTRHVNKWLQSRGITQAVKKPQKWIEEALEQGTFHAQNPALGILGNPPLRLRGGMMAVPMHGERKVYSSGAAMNVIHAMRDLVVRKTAHGEFRITFRGLPPEKAEAVAYYTDDPTDAVETAQKMLERGYL